MEKWQGKVAIVTGASSGIGAGTVRALASQGMHVLALARRLDRLQELAEELTREGAPGKVHPMKADLRKEEEILAAFAWADKELGGADVLVNNAGLYFLNNIIDATTEEWRNVLDVNVLAMMITTREYLKSMERRNNQNGHIFMINSVVGHVVINAGAAMYIGSKHCTTALCKCLRRELLDKNSTIKVTSVCPGLVNTEMSNGRPNEKEVKSLVGLEVEDVAKTIVDALSASPSSQICEVILTNVPRTFIAY